MKRTKKKKKRGVHLMIVVQRSSVLLSILEVSHNSNIIIRNRFQQIAVVDESLAVDEEHRLRLYAEALLSITSNIHVSDLKHITDVAVVFDSPWGGSVWKEVSLHNQKAIQYSEGVRNQLERQARTDFERISKVGSHKQILLGVTPIHEKLNGYHFQNPFGKRAEHIQVTFQYDLVASQVVAVFKSALAKILPHHSIRWLTRDTLLYGLVEKMLPVFNATTLVLFVDELRTSIILRNRFGAIERQIVQIGAEAILERIKQRFAKSHRQAEHFFKLYQRGELEEKVSYEFASELKEIARMWEEQTGQVIMHMSHDSEWPSRVMYTISESFSAVVNRDLVERVIKDSLPQRQTATFFDFRDSALVQDDPGILSDHTVHLYAASLV